MTSRPHWPFGMSASFGISSGHGGSVGRSGRPDDAEGFRADRIVHRSGHPSFTADVARSLVAALSVPQLHEVWRLSGAGLMHPVLPRTTTNLVVLRSAVLDALEAADPTFGSWLEDQPLPPGPRPRS